MSGENNKERKKRGFRETFRRGLNYHGAVDLWRRARAGEDTHKLLAERKRLYPKEYYVLFSVSLLIYSVLAYLVIVKFVEPTLISVYDFTAARATALGVFIEGELISLGTFTLIVYLLNRRFGRREKELLKAINDLTEEIRDEEVP